MAVEVRTATKVDVPEIAAMLAEAFRDDPTSRWVTGDEQRRRAKLPRAYAMELRNRYIPRGVTEIVVVDGRIRAGALWEPPGRRSVTGLTQLLSSPSVVWLAGMRRSGHLLRGIGFMEDARPRKRHWYLADIGTSPPFQRRGLGSRLLASRLARCDEQGEGVYLESSTAANVGYYEKFGFAVVAEIELPDGPRVWPMWRHPHGGSSAVTDR